MTLLVWIIVVYVGCGLIIGHSALMKESRKTHKLPREIVGKKKAAYYYIAAALFGVPVVLAVLLYVGLRRLD